jgi:hydrogenase-4 component E
MIPPNLLFWALALGAVLLAFELVMALNIRAGESRMLMTVAATGLLLGLLVLSTQDSPFSQIIGVLRIENAIALFELGLSRHAAPLALQLGQLALMGATIGLYRWYLTFVPGNAASEREVESEAPGL